MSQHLSEQIMERYQSGELSPAEVLALDDHLAECESCKAERRNNEKSWEAYAQVISALQPQTAFEEAHLAYQQLADYVDDALSAVDRELMDSHLESCRSCSAEVSDLEGTKASLAELPAARYSPRKIPSLWQSFAAWWQLPAIRIPVQVTAAIILVGFVIWLVMPYSRRPAQQAQEHSSDLERKQTAANNSPVAPPQDERNNVQLAADLIDGDRHITLSSDGKLSGLESASIQIQNEVVSALQHGRLKASSFSADLKGQSGRLMGARSSDYGLLSPLAIVIESRSPTFHWRAIEGAENYVVTIYGLDSKKIAASAPLTETKWKANSPLERGHIYTWQVRASKQGEEVLRPPPAAPEARFRIIDAAKAEELAQVRRSHAGSHLVLGLFYADAGLLDESERELRKLVDANPKSSIARSLLRSLEAQKRSR